MGSRRLILIRHAQYHSEPEELTDLGRAQAELVAARLAQEPIHTIISSLMPRAKETTKFIKHYHPDAKYQSTELLNERITYLPRKKTPWSDLLSEESVKEAHQQIEGAIHRFFKSTRSDDHTDVLVCHSNIIRTLVCRAMDFPVGAWSELRLHHCSITTFMITKSKTHLLGFNDIGHLPLVMQTEI